MSRDIARVFYFTWTARPDCFRDLDYKSDKFEKLENNG